MFNKNEGAFRLFRAFGVNVWLHWTWFLVLAWQLDRHKGTYSNPWWFILEYIGLFGIVLMHEFGHALACRQVGGQADRIILWPLGGIAYVAPPPRAGAYLWSIAAGPLVNVALVPVFLVINGWADAHGLAAEFPERAQLLETLGFINFVLLIFNILPIFPLDGGQIVRGILWFWLGPVKSLLVASAIGIAGGVAGALWAFSIGSIWLVIMALFALSQSWQAFQAARSQS